MAVESGSRRGHRSPRAIVGLVDKQIAAKGEAAILHELPRVKEVCGTGL